MPCIRPNLGKNLREQDRKIVSAISTFFYIVRNSKIMLNKPTSTWTKFQNVEFRITEERWANLVYVGLLLILSYPVQLFMISMQTIDTL